MDGHFVSNITNMMGIYSKPLDVHLMVCDVMKYVNIYEKLKPTYINNLFSSSFFTSLFILASHS